MSMITDKHKKEFEQSGFTVIRSLFDATEIQQITEWTNEVTNYPETPGKYMMYFENSQIDNSRILCRMEDVEPFHQGFSDIFLGEKMKLNVDKLFGEESVLFKDKINFKMPGGDGFKAHQDVQAGWDTYARIHITALVTIDPCTVENGCLEMAANFHEKSLVGEKWKPLDENAHDYIAIPTEPGDAVFFDSFVPHRSGPNMTDMARRVLYVTYNKRSEGDHRKQYYADKRLSYPPDCEREEGKDYAFKV